MGGVLKEAMAHLCQRQRGKVAERLQQLVRRDVAEHGGGHPPGAPASILRLCDGAPRRLRAHHLAWHGMGEEERAGEEVY